MADVSIRERNGQIREASIELSGQETAREVISIFGLDPEEYFVQVGNRKLALHEQVPIQGAIKLERKDRAAIIWKDSPTQGKIALTLAIHFARNPSETIGVEVQPTVTPLQLAETLVRREGGVNAEDIKQMIDKSGRNLMEEQNRNRSFGELDIRSGDTLEILGDVVQG
jgi:hypothetical protein